MRWPWQKQKPIETRASASSFTGEIIAARESYISGRRGIGELTATAQSCISLWENGFTVAALEAIDHALPFRLRRPAMQEQGFRIQIMLNHRRKQVTHLAELGEDERLLLLGRDHLGKLA